mmetsp:Transcript_1110/g.2550  ORF Transcript_1110/g.2550 Transcript_1110/m.2550 type:complete len:560 (+) Transcript_1110:116-1795(+)
MVAASKRVEPVAALLIIASFLAGAPTVEADERTPLRRALAEMRWFHRTATDVLSRQMEASVMSTVRGAARARRRLQTSGKTSLGGRQLTSTSRIYVCSWDATDEICSPSAEYTDGLLAEFKEGSPLEEAYMNQRQCSVHMDEGSCRTDTVCRWSPEQSDGERCEVALTKSQVEALSMSSLDTTHCGWVSAMLTGTECSLRPADPATCSGRCNITTEVVPLNGMCVENTVCDQTDAALVEALCGPGHELADLELYCSISGVETQDQVENRYIYCYRDICPQLGEMIGYLEGATFHCRNVEDREGCLAEPLCAWSGQENQTSDDSGCDMDLFEVWKNNVPVDCAYRSVIQTLQECYDNKNEEDCSFGCTWLVDAQCSAAVQADAITARFIADPPTPEPTTPEPTTQAPQAPTEAPVGSGPNPTPGSGSGNMSGNSTGDMSGNISGNLSSNMSGNSSQNSSWSPDDQPLQGYRLMNSTGQCVPTSAIILAAIASSGCTEGQEARTMAKLQYAVEECPRETRRGGCRLKNELPAVCFTDVQNSEAIWQWSRPWTMILLWLLLR